MLTQAELKELLSYDADTGQFTRLMSATRTDRIGKIAGKNRPDGYREIKINGKEYYAHRLAWLYVHGEWPADQIDHINGVRSDNRIDNLRLASKKQNMENRKQQINNKSGYRGVYWHTTSGKWRARVKHHGKHYESGSFDVLEEAAAAAKAMRDQLFTHNKTEYSA